MKATTCVADGISACDFEDFRGRVVRFHYNHTLWLRNWDVVGGREFNSYLCDTSWVVNFTCGGIVLVRWHD